MFFFSKSFIADLMASSANMEQCNLTGGNFKCDAISEFVIFIASCKVLPLIHSVANELDAIAEPHPKVLNFVSTILPESLNNNINFFHYYLPRSFPID